MEAQEETDLGLHLLGCPDAGIALRDKETRTRYMSGAVNIKQFPTAPSAPNIGFVLQFTCVCDYVESLVFPLVRGVTSRDRSYIPVGVHRMTAVV